MDAQISSPRTDVDGLDDLAPLWEELHRHHLEVSRYRHLVKDHASSWARRRGWYRRLLAQGASYVTAADQAGRTIGYAMIVFESGPDDTFDIRGGIAEIVTLVVTRDHRSTGVGRALVAAAESAALVRGFDTVKIAVMSGNTRAHEFYTARGYADGELVLYRRLVD
jgi:GNAT superfamily N-acetyltransferase